MARPNTNQPKMGAIGNVTGRIAEKVITPTKKDPSKSWAKLTITESEYGIPVKVTAFSTKAVNIIDSYAEGETISLWGVLSSNEYNGKTYTSFTAMNVNDDGAETCVKVHGRVTGVIDGEYSQTVKVLVQDDKYKSEVALEVERTTRANYAIGELITTYAYPNGKFGIWTIWGEPKGAEAEAPAQEGAGAETAPW